MITFNSVSAKYPGATRRAIDRVTFAAGAGSITAVVGPNGSGKSTLVRALLRRIQLLEGSIRVGDADIASLSASETAASVAILPQREDPVFPLSVADYVGLGRYPRLGLWKNESAADAAAVERAMLRAEVTAFATRKTDELSGGEWQRVRIARALAQQSRAIVLDEPTTFLDISHEMALFELLASLAAEGLAVLVISHELNLVSRFAERIVLLREGHVVAQGSAAEVMQSETLERAFDWPLRVIHDSALGGPVLFPVRQPLHKYSNGQSR